MSTMPDQISVKIKRNAPDMRELCSVHCRSLLQTQASFANSLRMFRAVVFFGGVAAVLALEIHLVLFYVGGEDIVRAHAENLRH